MSKKGHGRKTGPSKPIPKEGAKHEGMEKAMSPKKCK